MKNKSVFINLTNVKKLSTDKVKSLIDESVLNGNYIGTIEVAKKELSADIIEQESNGFIVKDAYIFQVEITPIKIFEAHLPKEIEYEEINVNNIFKK